MKLAPTTSSFKGGLKINSRCQVVNQYDEVIPGLYAAGEVGYVCHLRDSLVFGARAGAASGRYARFNPLVNVDMRIAGKPMEQAKKIQRQTPNEGGDPKKVKQLIKRVMMEYGGCPPLWGVA
jgi:succinate dehydrogenase/fumarate reductase flavoprotein subunit